MKEDVNWLSKKDYGTTPDYLNQIKNNIETEYNMI